MQQKYFIAGSLALSSWLIPFGILWVMHNQGGIGMYHTFSNRSYCMFPFFGLKLVMGQNFSFFKILTLLTGQMVKPVTVVTECFMVY